MVSTGEWLATLIWGMLVGFSLGHILADYWLHEGLWLDLKYHRKGGK